jgi:hypothetical protein
MDDVSIRRSRSATHHAAMVTSSISFSSPGTMSLSSSLFMGNTCSWLGGTRVPSGKEGVSLCDPDSFPARREKTSRKHWAEEVFESGIVV